jgi:excinuclease UvrABC ATPase subunit
VHRLNELLVQIRDKGNTVLVVEHEPDVIGVGDHVPGAGHDGGRIVFEGTPEELVKHEGSLTGRHLAMRHA